MQDKGAVRPSLGAEDDGSIAIRKREHDPDARAVMPWYLDDRVIPYIGHAFRRAELADPAHVANGPGGRIDELDEAAVEAFAAVERGQRNVELL